MEGADSRRKEIRGNGIAIMKQLSVHELKQWIESGKDFMLVDVREVWEHTEFNIGGENIPLGTIMSRKGDFPKDKDIAIYCKKGIRSVIAIQRLEDYGFDRLYNVSGGMKAWKEAK